MGATQSLGKTETDSAMSDILTWTQEAALVWLRPALTAECTALRTVQTTQDELVNIIYIAEATQRPALHNNDKASRA